MAHLTMGIHEFGRVNELSTSIALISFCSSSSTTSIMACSINKSISQEGVTSKTELLISNLFHSSLFTVNIVENILSDFSVLFGRCASKEVEVTIKPIVNAFMNSVVVVTNLFAGLLFFLSLLLSSSAILISTTNVDNVVSSLSEVTSRHISGQNASNNVTQVRYVVDIRQSTCNQDVTLALTGEYFFIRNTLNFSVRLVDVSIGSNCSSL